MRVPEVILVLPDPSVAHGGGLGDQYADAGYYFTAADATRIYRIFVLLARIGSGTYETRVICTVGNTAIPGADFSQTLTSAGTTVYEAGGLLAIEKDFDEDEVRFITPGGNVTAVPSAWGGNDNAQMRPSAMGNRLNLRVPRLSAHQNTVDWSHFWGSQNGTRYMGAPRSEDQPGSFTGWAVVIPPGAGVPPHDTSFVQQVTSFRSEQSATLLGSYGQSLEIYEEQWDGGDTIPPMTLPAIEMTRSDEHGVIWAAFTKSDYRERLLWRRSHDGGATWTEGVISEIDGQVVRNPNLYWFGSRLVACWTNGTLVYQAFSHSLGEHWDAATPVGFDLGFLADNPRLRVVCDRRTGIAYYFARGNDPPFAGALVLKRSFDRGDSFEDEVIDIHAAIDDAIIDATITQDSRVHVRFLTALGYESYTSSSWGQWWEAEPAAVGLGTNPRSTDDHRAGWTFHVNWVELNTSLFAYGDPEFGLRAANSEIVAGPGLVEQVADVEMRPDGAPLIAYWESGEVFTVKRSFDWANTWES